MVPESELKPKGRGRVVVTLLLVLALPIVPFLLLKPYGLNDLEYWQSILDPLSNQTIKAFSILGLMATDLLLPIPSIPLLLWSGHQLGFALGTFINLLSLTLAHTIAFEVCRFGGYNAYRRYIGKKNHDSSSDLFRRYGPPALVFSRNIPVLSEVFSALAGLSNMKRRRFQISILISNFPTALTLAWLGSKGSHQLMITGALSIMIVPLVFLMIIRSKIDGPELKIK